MYEYDSTLILGIWWIFMMLDYFVTSHEIVKNILFYLLASSLFILFIRHRWTFRHSTFKQNEELLCIENKRLHFIANIHCVGTSIRKRIDKIMNNFNLKKKWESPVIDIQQNNIYQRLCLRALKTFSPRSKKRFCWIHSVCFSFLVILLRATAYVWVFLSFIFDTCYDWCKRMNSCMTAGIVFVFFLIVGDFLIFAFLLCDNLSAGWLVCLLQYVETKKEIFTKSMRNLFPFISSFFTNVNQHG